LGVAKRLMGNACNGNKAIKGISDIATTHPHLIKYFKNIEDVYKYKYASSNKVWMVCPNCGEEKFMKISRMTYYGFLCPKCSDGISMATKIMINILKQLNIDFETEYSPKWCKYLFKGKLRQGRYDFYVYFTKKIIEADGGFHNKDNSMTKQTKEESQEIDNEKDRLAEENGIDVIRIDCDYENNRFEYIKNSIINNVSFNKVFDISNIDWTLVEKESTKNLFKEICNIWNETKNIEYIHKRLNISKSTITRCLNDGTKLNLCEYDGKKELAKCITIINKKKQIEIFCITTNRKFNSLTEASELYNVPTTNISKCFKGQRKSAGKLRDGTPLIWKYYDEYFSEC
jgi:very-short-patch-repair endonuclease/ribosomal protein S27AE